MQSRIDELEFKVAYQEDILQKLNDEIATQQAEIAQMQHLLKVMAKEIERLKNQQEEFVNNEPPPHY